MNGYDLLEKMELVDADWLQEAEAIPTPVRRPHLTWGVALAASLCVLIAGVWLVRSHTHLPAAPDGEPPVASAATTEATTETTIAPNTLAESEIIYNPVTVRDAAYRRRGPIFYENVTADELAALVPVALRTQSNISGTAVYVDEGRLESIYLSLDDRAALTVFDAANPPIADCVYQYEHVEESHVGALAVTAFSYDGGDYVRLEVDFQRDGVGYRLVASPALDAVEDAKSLLQNVVTAYAADTAVPDLGIFTMREEHIWVDEALTDEQARADAAFGRYMLPAAPQGFALESARRHQGDRQNYLTALWSHGYDNLTWRVHTMTDSDRERLVAATDTRSYDLALYPIPRAESVPEELWAVVDDPVFRIDDLTREVVWRRTYTLKETGGSDDWRLHFSVLYDDTVVTVTANGVSPDWVYEQLMALK